MRATPGSTYRLQIHAGFTLFDAIDVVPYLHDLGVSHLYLSPILRPAPGSTHGYDVIDHSTVHPEAGGIEGLRALRAAADQRGLGLIVDVVPNHMALPSPARLNAALWSLLELGKHSPYADWFDIDVDWSESGDGILMPVLGDRIGQVVANGQLRVETPADGPPVLRYGEQVFPLRPGTAELPLAELLTAQWYRLAWWRVGQEELNYRRFFDIDTLAALRMELPTVFEETHRLLLDLVAEGLIDGLRIDHIDGLARPAQYLQRLADATQGIWVVAEKILSAEESLPSDWNCAGTTGYESLWRVGGLFVEPSGGGALTTLLTEFTDQGAEFAPIAELGKREVVDGVQAPEVHRLAERIVEICADDVMLRDHTRGQITAAVTELLVAMDRYRAYVVPGEPAPLESVRIIERAADRARDLAPEPAAATVDLVRDLVLDRAVDARSSETFRAAMAEVVIRFQQTCGPVMAKGVEDTAFYRWHRLTALNEVGGEPQIFGVTPEAFHDFAATLQSQWPHTMTTLSTHDTKRSEDLRARIMTLSELPASWADAVRELNTLTASLRGAQAPADDDVYLFWQTLIGMWPYEETREAHRSSPVDPERLVEYMLKAAREATVHTAWTTTDEAYEAALTDFIRSALADPEVLQQVATLCRELQAPARVNILGQKLIQLTMPGVPDVYQGCESVQQALVDPDNRRPVNFKHHAQRLARLDAGGAPIGLEDEKIWITSNALRVRRNHPEAFVGQQPHYEPLATTTGNALAFARGTTQGPATVTVATRLSVALAERGGWGAHTVMLPQGRWRDVLRPGSEPLEGGSQPLGELFSSLPVALLVRA